MKNFIQIIFVLAIYNSLHAQVAPNIEWQKCLGGSGNEAAFSVQQITDGDFMVAGYSDLNDGDVTGNHGADDYWLVRLDASSNLLGQKSLGGTSLEQANAVDQTTDGGFIIAGYSYSNNGDVSGNHGSDDYWIVKLNQTGDLEWQKCFGGSGDDGATCIQQTSDGGYIIAGWSASNDGDVTGNHGLMDYWVLKLDAAGYVIWRSSFGGSQNDVAYSVDETTDGGFIIAGYSESNDGDVWGNNGARDYWIVKVSAGGFLVWQTFLGGSDYDEAHAIQQVKDGGFIIAGFAGSSDGDVTGNHGVYDYWVIKLSSIGILEWKSCYGGTSVDQPFTIQQTKDAGFIVAGQSNSNNGDVSGNHGGYDYWVVKLDTAGTLVWQKSLGGSNDEYGPYRVQETTDGGYILGGASLSNDLDVSGNHGGSFYGDCWIVKLEGNDPTLITSPSNNSISVYPNPVQNQLTLSIATLSNPVFEGTILVYDLSDRIIELPVTVVNSVAHVNSASLPNGFYTLRITNAKTGKSAVGKFVKQE